MMNCAIVILAAVALAVAPVQAGGTARQLFDAASLAYDRGRYDDAARAFEAAYRLLPRPQIAFSLAQAQRRQYFVDGDRVRLVRSIELYHRYLDEVSEGGRRADAVQQLQTLEPLLLSLGDEPADEGSKPTRPQPATELMVYASAPGAEVALDEGTFFAAPTIFPTSEGSHRIDVRARGFVSRSVTTVAVAGRLMPVEVSLAEQPARLDLRVNTKARVLVDGVEVGNAPLKQPLELASGKHDVSVVAPGRVSGVRTVVLERGETRTLEADLPRTVQREVALALLGSSAALWVGGAVTAGVAFGFQRRARRVDDLRGERNIETSELEQQGDDIRRRNQLRGATIGLWSAAAVSGIVGLALMFTDRG